MHADPQKGFVDNSLTVLQRTAIGGMAGGMGGLAGAGVAGALARTSLSMTTQAFLTGAAAGFYGGSTARILSGTGITPATIAQDTILGGTSGLVAFGVASVYQQATAPKPSTTSLQERANLAAQLSEAEGCERGIPDFYVGPNGKVLPSQYKDWIETNMQHELLSQAENPQLQNAIKQLYRENSFMGDGGTADIIRFEQQTGLMLGQNGGSHIPKGVDMIKYIENRILTQNLSPSDRALAMQLLEDLNNALGR